MKQYKSFIVAVAALAVVSCADDKFQSYQIADPDAKHSADYAYLNEMNDLKSYTNPKASSTFKLGGAMEASDFMKKEQYYALGVANFDEIVAGNAMKMASCVTDKGVFDYAAVTSFVNTADEAGLDVYGHTLAWHSQQPVRWLSSLIADKDLPIDPNASNNFLKITAPKVEGAVSYTWQIYYVLPTPLETGKTYKLTMRAKTTKSFKMGFWPYRDGGVTQYLADPSVPEEWGELSWEFTAADNLEQLQWAIGFLEGELDFDDIKLVEAGTDVNLVENGNFNEESTTGWRKNSWHGNLKFELGHEGSGPQEYQIEVKRNCLEVVSADKVQDAWETQLWLVTDATFAAGDEWEVSFACRANKNATASTQIHKEAGGTGYLWYVGIGEVPFTLKWQNFSAKGTFDANQAGGHSIAFNLNELAEGTEYYFDNISVKINGVEQIVNGNCEGTETKSYVAKEKNGSAAPGRIVDKYMETRQGNSIPLTDEEKKDTLTWAMDKWISGMMEACGGKVEGKVKAWDVVNEAIGQSETLEDGFYALQHGKEGDTQNFFWQDYLGDLDYVRTAVRLAREYGPADVKLFINDYNLESDWDNNWKVKSLINWIGKWEADGVTKIDGIGTQMHIWCYSNPTVQESKKAGIVNMFKELAKSGKLVRISELDMGYTNGTTGNEEKNMVATANMTEDQHKQMAELYNWVIQQYFEIIPAEQQWGICQWCITDSPSNSGWRPNEPVGLWDQNFYRKHVYGGFATGLAGKPYEPGK